MVSTFYVWCFEFSLGSFRALCKISDVKIVKRLLLPQFQPNYLMESIVMNGGIQAFPFSEIHSTWTISHVSYIAIFHKAMLVSSGKRSSCRVSLLAGCILRCL